MLPLLVIVGRPNVGKSTLFNCLTRTHDALVADLAGVTRDRRYGVGRIGECQYLIADTGGLGEEHTTIGYLVAEQVVLAIEEADALIFVVDARAGLTTTDQNIATQLRRYGKPIIVAANKIDGLHETSAVAEFYALGFESVLPISASHRRGLRALVEHVFADQDEADLADTIDSSTSPIISITGQPNVGKSTLVNRLAGADRVITNDTPGTTRDSIWVQCERNGRHYTLVDTAGVRRRARVNTHIERISAIGTLRAIAQSNVVVVMLDAISGVSEQDLTLLGTVIEHGRALVIALNKWDGLTPERQREIPAELQRRTEFARYISVCPISALHGWGLSRLIASADTAYAAAKCKMPTPTLTRTLLQAVEHMPPPLVHRRRIKLRYAHQGGSNPPLIVIHGNQTEAVPAHYRRYLSGWFRRVFRLQGTPVVVEFRSGENPYQGRRNVLTPRQQRKRQRLMRHVRK